MTGASSAQRSSSSTPSLRRLGRRAQFSVLGASVVLGAFASACSSELADGAPGSEGNGVPGFTPPGVVQPGGPGNGVTAPGGDGIVPVDVMNGQSDRDPTISGTGDIGPLTDANGMPLPVDQLPPLQACNTPGPQVLRRLNTAQFRNTLVSVFGDAAPESNPLNDALTLGYDVDSDDLVVQGLDAQALGSLSEELSTAVVANAGFMGQLTNGCTDRNNNDCRQQFVRNLGERISREPLNQQRIDRFAALFTEQVDGVDLAPTFNEGAELVIQAMVQSPYMVYRREIGTQQGAEFVLTQFEVASELSYMLTNNPPDAALMQAARDNQLSTPEQVLAQADRLLATAPAEDVLSGFVTAWLDIDRLEGKVKAGVDISESLRQAMLNETSELFLDVFRNDGTIGDLFSATYTFMNQELADFYGLQGMAGSPDFTEVDIAGGVRVPGVLGHGSYLAAHALADNSSPVQRAFVVRERILCNDLPAVPTNLDTNLKPQAPTATSRERYTAHSENPVCYNCHQLMDPIGFTFEAYDGYGRFRAQEAGKPVDTSGGLPLMDENGPIGLSVPMSSVNDLASYLSVSEQTRACLVNNISYYAYGIANDAKWAETDKVCTDHYIRQVARDSGNTLKSVMTGILTAPHFTRRVQAK